MNVDVKTKTTTEVILPSAWFPGNAVRTELNWWRLAILAVLVICFTVVITNSFAPWIGGLLLVGIVAIPIQLLKSFRQLKSIRENPDNWCFCYFGIPQDIYTSATNILVRPEFGGGVRIIGKGVNYAIPSTRILTVESGNFLDNLPERWGMRIDWKADSGGINSLYLADFVSLNKDQFDHWKGQIMSPAALEERLPKDVSWLPPKKFKLPVMGFAACAGSVTLTVITVEMINNRFNWFESSSSHIFWQLALNVFFLTIVFGFFLNRYEERALAETRAEKGIAE